MIIKSWRTGRLAFGMRAGQILHLTVAIRCQWFLSYKPRGMPNEPDSFETIAVGHVSLGWIYSDFVDGAMRRPAVGNSTGDESNRAGGPCDRQRFERLHAARRSPYINPTVRRAHDRRRAKHASLSKSGCQSNQFIPDQSQYWSAAVN